MLKELEADGMIHRKEYPQIPPKVEYSLSEKGKSLIPILGEMCDWGEAHREIMPDFILYIVGGSPKKRKDQAMMPESALE